MALKQALKEKGIKPQELANRIHRSRRTVYRYTQGEQEIPPGMARLISMATGIKLADILGDGNGA